MKGVNMGTSPPKFKSGQWVRRKLPGECLVQINTVYPQKRTRGLLYGVDADYDEKDVLFEYELEPAYPHDGEWWRLREKSCSNHAHRIICGTKSFQWENLPDPSLAEYVVCGCLEPVNFGWGNIRGRAT